MLNMLLPGKEKFAKFLIRNGANVNIADDSGKSALHWAAREGKTIVD